MDLGDKRRAHSGSLLSVELALGQGHTFRGSADKLGAGSMDYPKMCEVAGGQLQHTEVVAQCSGRTSKGNGALPAEHPDCGILRSLRIHRHHRDDARTHGQ